MIEFAYAATTSGNNPAAGGGMSSIVLIVLMVAIFYFMLIRPESKRKKQAEEMRSSLQKGDWLTTIGGVYGRVVAITDRTVVIETSEDRVRIEFLKSAIGSVGTLDEQAPAAYGRYNNVILTDTELSGLKTELPDKWEYYIDRLSCHIASTGKQYQSHAATIYKWAQEDAAKGKAAPKQGIPDYSCKEGESL